MAHVNVLGTTAGPLPITGTAGADLIRISQSGSAITITKNGAKSLVHSGDVSQILIEVGGGNDQVYVDASVVTPIYVLGGAGNDTIAGGSGHDTLTGSAGHDRIAGGTGNDLLNGNGGSDRLVGDAGADRIVAGDGDDFLDGGSSGDRLLAGAGLDRIFGGNGDDFFHTVDSQTDTVDGGAGSDTADEDVQDVLTSVEV
jgi:Ca2+-binding RTX toxin-like protein